MYKHLIAIILIIIFEGCENTSTGTEESSSENKKTEQQSQEFFCKVEKIENGYKQILNFPDHFYFVTEITRYSDELALFDYDYVFYGRETYDFPKLCADKNEELKLYVEGSYHCKNNHLTYKVLEDYHESGENGEKNTIEEFYAEALNDCKAKHEWYLEEIKGYTESDF